MPRDWGEGERDSYELHEELLRNHPEYIKVLEADDQAEYDPSFLGFVNVYKHLAAVIPTGRIVYDFGCCYAAQAWYFRHHAGYVGIEPSSSTQLHTPNATYHHMTAQEYLKMSQEYGSWREEKRAGFAIINYVPDHQATEQVKAEFRDCFSFYPVRGDRHDEHPIFHKGKIN